MQNLIEYLVKALVDEPDLVNITEVPQEEATTYEVRVAPGDLGKVIGKQGPHCQRAPHRRKGRCNEKQAQGLRRNHRVVFR